MFPSRGGWGLREGNNYGESENLNQYPPVSQHPQLLPHLTPAPLSHFTPATVYPEYQSVSQPLTATTPAYSQSELPILSQPFTDTSSHSLFNLPQTLTPTTTTSEYPLYTQPLIATTTHSLSQHLDLSQPLTTTSFPSLSQSSPVSGDGMLSAAWGTVGNTGGTNMWGDVTVMDQGGGSSVTDEPWLTQPAGSLVAGSSVPGGMRQTDHVREEDSSGMWNVDSSTKSDASSAMTLASSEASAEPDTSSGKRPRRQRKTKVYQWEPQQDPQLEKKRLRAVREYQKRQQEEQEEQKLNHQLAETNREINRLRHQVVSRRQQVDALEQQSLHQHQTPQDTPPAQYL